MTASILEEVMSDLGDANKVRARYIFQTDLVGPRFPRKRATLIAFGFGERLATKTNEYERTAAKTSAVRLKFYWEWFSTLCIAFMSIFLIVAIFTFIILLADYTLSRLGTSSSGRIVFASLIGGVILGFSIAYTVVMIVRNLHLYRKYRVKPRKSRRRPLPPVVSAYPPTSRPQGPRGNVQQTRGQQRQYM